MGQLYRRIGLSLEWSCHGIPWLLFVTVWLGMLWQTTKMERGGNDSLIAPSYRARSWTLEQWKTGPNSSLFPNPWTQAICLLSALLIDLCVVALLKMCVRRPRPKDDIMSDMRLTVPIDMWSFPSVCFECFDSPVHCRHCHRSMKRSMERDLLFAAELTASSHATRASLLFWLLPHFFAFSNIGIGLLALWTLIICYSRFAMRRHHATDILAGSIIGFLEYRLVWMIDWIYVTHTVTELVFPVQLQEL
ncbi:unnamed protein product [Echinostoma caproni]|uniref:AcidPPc domain-containing protein n=1 Tax=Echinostoma caproni TaxID=27848 RepID=A0A183AWN6_9TREM|nr:unnamed protein product [Echinostoma caproni]